MDVTAHASAVVRVAPPDVDDFIGVLERQWPEQHCIDYTEDGAVGADAEGEGEDRNHGEDRSFDQHPEGIFQVC